MKALILNSGMGSRMEKYTQDTPKCMVSLLDGKTIIERQLELLVAVGVQEAVITTGFLADKLRSFVESLETPMKVSFVHNDRYDSTNYIYSMYLAGDCLEGDILLLHGDLVFEQSILEEMLAQKQSCMAVSTACAIPEKDFKAVVREGKILKIGIEFFENVVAAQPLYMIKSELWKAWKKKMEEFYQADQLTCYAENALNEILVDYSLVPFDYGQRLCQEVDRKEDLQMVRKALENEKVY
ncbi:MAG: phosphocholine cytidylyltransferase family protein [Lachnospiraceae bacterium]|nr:phosphocholine cytidylyltransferase family protein [Lachnospiraceae bacterium]